MLVQTQEKHSEFVIGNLWNQSRFFDTDSWSAF